MSIFKSTSILSALFLFAEASSPLFAQNNRAYHFTKRKVSDLVNIEKIDKEGNMMVTDGNGNSIVIYLGSNRKKFNYQHAPNNTKIVALLPSRKKNGKDRTKKSKHKLLLNDARKGNMNDTAFLMLNKTHAQSIRPIDFNNKTASLWLLGINNEYNRSNEIPVGYGYITYGVTQYGAKIYFNNSDKDRFNWSFDLYWLKNLTNSTIHTIERAGKYTYALFSWEANKLAVQQIGEDGKISTNVYNTSLQFNQSAVQDNGKEFSLLLNDKAGNSYFYVWDEGMQLIKNCYLNKKIYDYTALNRSGNLTQAINNIADNITTYDSGFNSLTWNTEAQAYWLGGYYNATLSGFFALTHNHSNASFHQLRAHKEGEVIASALGSNHARYYFIHRPNRNESNNKVKNKERDLFAITTSKEFPRKHSRPIYFRKEISLLYDNICLNAAEKLLLLNHYNNSNNTQYRFIQQELLLDVMPVKIRYSHFKVNGNDRYLRRNSQPLTNWAGNEEATMAAYAGIGTGALLLAGWGISRIPAVRKLFQSCAGLFRKCCTPLFDRCKGCKNRCNSCKDCCGVNSCVNKLSCCKKEEQYQMKLEDKIQAIQLTAEKHNMNIGGRENTVIQSSQEMTV